MATPLQIDQREYTVNSPTAAKAISSIREEAQKVHPEAQLAFETRRTEEGFVVQVDYWLVPVDFPATVER